MMNDAVKLSRRELDDVVGGVDTAGVKPAEVEFETKITDGYPVYVASEGQMVHDHFALIE